MKDFKDKVLVVTGAGNGIGKEIAKEGALRGMKLVLNDIDPSDLEKTITELKEKFPVEIVSQAADITQIENIKALFNLTMKHFAQVDMLVNNAGIAISTPVWEIPVQDIQWITEANFLSHVYGMRLFIPQMIKQATPAAVINVASGAGLMITGNAAMYHATKTADIALAESTYIGLRERGHRQIQVHALCPAFVQTDLFESERHRPERYQNKNDPYYENQEYLSSIYRTKRSVKNGMAADSVGMTVFTAVEEEKFYILTHPEILYPAKQKYEAVLNLSNPG